MAGGAVLAAPGSGPLPAAAAPDCAVAGAGSLAFEAEKILLRKLSGPPPLEDCARASPPSSKVAASINAAACWFAENPVRRIMVYPCRAKRPRFQEALSRFPIT